MRFKYFTPGIQNRVFKWVVYYVVIINILLISSNIQVISRIEELGGFVDITSKVIPTQVFENQSHLVLLEVKSLVDDTTTIKENNSGNYDNNNEVLRYDYSWIGNSTYINNVCLYSSYTTIEYMKELLINNSSNLLDIKEY